MNIYLNILLISFAIISIIVIVTLFIKAILKHDNYKIINPPKEEPQPKYKGLCLFDIDGTLTTGYDNEKSVDICLKAGYAVGISTAGSLYHPDNLLSFSWMPKNLYNWMKEHNFDTFNNVASDILAGEYNPEGYAHIKNRYRGHIIWGLLKGHSLTTTAAKYNITDDTQMILFDNDPGFLQGLRKYNKNFNLVCAGDPCGDTLKPQTVIEALNRST